LTFLRFHLITSSKMKTSLAIIHALPLLRCGLASSAAFTPALVDQLIKGYSSDELANEGKVVAPGDSSVNDTLVTITLAPGQYLTGKESHSGSGRHFLGVPYAAPPVGDLRWRTPQPPVAWTGVRKALDFGASCMQKPDLVYNLGSGAPSEDCLYLNVYTPDPATVASAEASSGWPIMIFFHGGSWESGSGACPLYYGGNLVNNTGAAIVVTVNYRLNTLGFLGGDALRDPSDGGSTGKHIGKRL
jgi:para-nitrobenzyl esterase